MKKFVLESSLFTLFISINYILTITFLKAFYPIYFSILFFVCYFIYKIKFDLKKSIFFVYLFLFAMSVFLIEYFDLYIFDIYLFLDLEKFYIYVGGSIAYILAILHSIIFFFTAFKKS